eukprot:TRINITY_DN5853_c0_g1_i1.p1 TRINITY_DN5853_c0_g1~~TRINITY_DN5853_c0_g1_i1.p1  ORF type:complete len:179 (-),score=38.54 TRINITY_DN5853_c0_g1_i1:584-1084(-)
MSKRYRSAPSTHRKSTSHQKTSENTSPTLQPLGHSSNKRLFKKRKSQDKKFKRAKSVEKERDRDYDEFFHFDIFGIVRRDVHRGQDKVLGIDERLCPVCEQPTKVDDDICPHCLRPVEVLLDDIIVSEPELSEELERLETEYRENPNIIEKYEDYVNFMFDVAMVP